MGDALPPFDLDALHTIPDDERRLEATLAAAWDAVDGDNRHFRELAEQAGHLADFLHDRTARLTARAMLAHACFRDTEYDAARSYALEALHDAHIDPGHDVHHWDEALEALPRRAREALAEAATALAISTFRLGGYPDSLLYANLEAYLRHALGDVVGEALARHGLGWGYDKVGLYQQALEQHSHALAVLEPVAPELTASPLNGVAETYLNLGHIDKAMEYSERALEVMGDANGPCRERSTALRAIGLALQRKRDYDAAESFFRRSMELSDAYGVSLNLLSLGDMYLELGRIDDALEAFRRCLNELGPGAQKRSRCQALLGTGEAELARGRPHEALHSLRAALRTAEEVTSPVELYRAHHGMARALREIGDTEAALDHYEAYHRHREQVLREASDVRTEVLTLQFDVERLRRDREIDRLTNVELAQAYRELQELHRRLERQAAELERLSNLDGLTGLQNRRSLDARLETELARARRNGAAVSLLMLDIDNFKAINDRFSHTVGDEVLKRLARLLRGSLRDVDLCARFGGEEFAVVMPDTGLAGATEVAEKLRMVVEAERWNGVHPEIRITVSVGVASLRPHEDASTLLARADAMLYRAKRVGKNCVQS
ncbi:MAG: diguanylate cyclase [Deinococcales bacterium]